MPYTGLRQDHQGKWILPAEGFVQRINRKLSTMVPYRDLWFHRNEREWYVRILATDHPRHGHIQGPYHWKYLVPLARMIGVFNRSERQCQNITLVDKAGLEFHEAPLPNHLKFSVVTKALQDMQRQLESAGYEGKWNTEADNEKYHLPQNTNTVLDDGRMLTDIEQAELDLQIAKRDEARAALARDAARTASAEALAPSLPDEVRAQIDNQVEERQARLDALRVGDRNTPDRVRTAHRNLPPAMPDEARAAPAPTVAPPAPTTVPEDEDAAVQAMIDRLLEDDTVTAAVTGDPLAPERSKGAYLGWGVYADDAQSVDDVDEHEQPPDD